jgi:hypothetical protein
MATSTVSVIHQSLVDLLVGLTPRGDIARGENRFKHIEYGLPVNDREVFVGELEPIDTVFFGVVAEQDYIGEFDVVVAHRKSLDMPVDQQRIGEDISTIHQAFEASSNFPTGVSLIRLKGLSKIDATVDDEDDEEIQQTTMRFGINYSLASVGV